MPALFRTPDLDLTDHSALDDLAELRSRLTAYLRTPRTWTGGLRRSAQAKAIRGSNSIEGYVVSAEDALAAVDDEDPMTADERTWAEIIGYRRVLTYVLHMANDPDFRLDAHTLRSMHFMLLEHAHHKSPGRYRQGEILVEQEQTGERVYTGPQADLMPALMDALTTDMNSTGHTPAVVQAAMAHLNLVMIHPFRNGNGRMARALQTLLLARDHPVDPIFDSIEEWLGANTDDYYRILALTGAGSWQPDRDAHPWVKFCLRAHHMQAQTVARRFDEAHTIGSTLLELVAARGLPERTFDPVFEAAMGMRVRRPGYVRRSGIEERTASRDLKQLVDAGLLEAQGQTKGRFYVAAGPVRDLGLAAKKQRAPLIDPYPDLMARAGHQLRTPARHG